MSDEFDTIHDGIDELGEEPPNPDAQLAQSEEARKRAEDAEAKLAKLPADWEQDSSLETWFPLTAQELITLRAQRDQWRTVAQELYDERPLSTDTAAAAHYRALVKAVAAEPQTNEEQSNV